MVRFIFVAALALLVVGVVCLPSGKADHVAGQIYDGYFTYGSDGYYHYGNAIYSRYLVTNPGYYSYGYYYPGSSYYKYTQVYQPSAYTTSPPAYAPGWKTEVLKYAQTRDDAQLYSETLRALGFNGQSYSFQQYGAYTYNPLPAGYSPQGATQYGYSVSQAREAYGYSVDLNKLAQMSGQLTQGAQAMASQANSETNGVVTELGKNAARVAEILAKGQAAAQALQAVKPEPSSSSVTTVTGTGAGASAVGNGAAMGLNGNGGNTVDLRQFLETVAKPTCGGCHSGADAKGKFDINTWGNLSAERKAEVYERLTSRDPKLRMPRNQDGTPGALTKQQLASFVSN